MQKRLIVETINGPLAGIPRIIGCLKITPGQPVKERFLRVNLGDHIGDAQLVRENKTYVWYQEVDRTEERDRAQHAFLATESMLRMQNHGNGDEPGSPMA